MAGEAARRAAHLPLRCAWALLWALLPHSAWPARPQVQSGEEPVLTQSPSDFITHVNETLRLICDLSRVRETPDKQHISWHAAYNGNTPAKIADLMTETSGRYSTSWDNASRTAELKIPMLGLNDSGDYHCAYITFQSLHKGLKESNRIRLNVSGTIKMPSTETPKVTHKRLPGLSTETAIIVGVTPVALCLLIGLIVFMYTWQKRGKKKPQSGAANVGKSGLDRGGPGSLRKEAGPPRAKNGKSGLDRGGPGSLRKEAGPPRAMGKEEPANAPVYTLEYGVLEFHGDGKAARHTKISVADNVEYATIMLPSSMPATGDWNSSGKKDETV
ncbi:programmed cell death protein 1 isoform X1 [Ambystoma mexicanum]|uniref:programmed cell death protein 1 isoform X1 n=1 Tax=Ambystoma mexicanum TaxID=8296 RepID=UPI0037E78EF3